MQSNSFAVVTGASKGLGKALAEELSKRKINTIIIGLPNEGLPKLSRNLMAQFGTVSVPFETDLTVKENIVQLASEINNQFPVSILINNAGAGGTRRFTEVNVDYIDRIIQLNIMATSVMTHQLLPNLEKQDQSYILNVSSMAAFTPIGYKTVYPASKVFVHYFSRGLYQELIDSNVFVSVVNPGPMETNPEVTRRIQKQGFLARMSLMTPERVAQVSIRQLFKKDSMIMLNRANGFN
ncbi:MAG: SDR family NAD(P)-dependent oxidoreductase, partial [Bacteroidetes bacterium]